MSAPLPPGPPGHWLSGNVGEFRRDMLGFYERLARDYGDVASYRLGPRRLVLVSRPDLVEQVLVTENRNFIKHYALRLLAPTLGNGLVTSEGALWLRQRRLIQPAFSRERVESYAGLFVEHTQRMLDGWRDGEVRDLHGEMMQLALGIVTRALLGVDAGGRAREVAAAADAILRDFNERFQSAFPLRFWLPAPANLRLRKVIGRLDQIIHEIIAQRRADPANRGDLLSVLVHARDEEDRTGMTDRQLRDEVMTLFLAGHETTANALAWTWYLLASHRDFERRLAAELEILEGREPTAADVPRLPFTEHVLYEALRLYPPAYVFGRQSLAECRLGDFRVPAGTTLLMSPWVMHRDPRWFERPLEFDPDRWSNGLARRLPKFAYFPFGGGPRVCIGNNFALLEAALVIATVVPRFTFRLESDRPAVPWASVTLRPRDGVRAVVSVRQPKPVRGA